MSFRCEFCNKLDKSPRRTTTKVKHVNHRMNVTDKKTGITAPVVTGYGPQIVSQKDLCGTCASSVVVASDPGEERIEIEKVVEEEDDNTGYYDQDSL